MGRKKNNWKRRHGIGTVQGSDPETSPRPGQGSAPGGGPAGKPDVRPTLQVVRSDPQEVPGEPAAAMESQVARLLAKGKVREAIALAKDLVRKKPGDAAEKELATAYCARIDELVKDRAYREALDLARVAAGRHAVGRELVGPRVQELELRAGTEDVWTATVQAAQTGDPQAVSLLRRCLELPSLITKLDGLHPESPLRCQARALGAGLTAVTSGPVPHDRVLLAEVPRKSPLADWKWLIRAIHSFYAREDAHCRRYIAAISPDSAPARAADVLLALLDGRTSSLKGSALPLAQKLVRGGTLGETTAALNRLVARLPDAPVPQVGRSAEALFKACRQELPDRLQVLQREVLIHAAPRGIPFYALLRNLERALETDADFWIRLAVASERNSMLSSASLCWAAALDRLSPGTVPGGNAALRVAIRRQLALCAAGCARSKAAPLAREVPRPSWPLVHALVWPGTAFSDHEFQSRTGDLLVPDTQYADLCREAPHQTHFANWYRNANEFNAGDWKLLDRIAGLWSAAHPTEHGPLLLLAAQAEERDAYTTAIKHLSAARRLGAPVSEVDHARRRLTVRKALRHLKERNQKGAWADIAELAEIPGGKEGNSKVVRHALMWFAHRMAAQETVAAELKKELDRDAGSPLTSALLLESLHDRIRRSLIPTDLLRDAVGKGVPPDAVWNAVTSGIRISGEFGLGFFLPHLWKDLLVQHLSSPGITVDPDDLRVVGGLVIRSKFRNLLLVISHLGLASGRHAAWFLAMRAAGLSPWKFHGRSHTCWRLAVYELNRTNDVALRSVIHEVNAARHLPLPMDLMASLSWPVVGGSPAEVAQVARRESSIPINGIEAKDFKDGPYAVPFRCECERCRRAREERAEMESWRKSARGNAPGREPDAEGKGRVAHVAYGDYDPDDYEDDDYGDYDPGDYEDDDYEDDDYEDDDYDDRDSDGKGLVALPQDIMEELFQIVQRFLRPDGSMPDPAELWRLAPGPLRKVLDKLEASGITPEDVFGPSARGPRGSGRSVRRRRR